jgi:hypothetical protein
MAIIQEFAVSFASKGKGNGLTKEEIVSYFRRYSANVVDPDYYGDTITKQQVFSYCLERLHVEDQYRALVDLCTCPPESVNKVPEEAQRGTLLEQLYSYADSTGLALQAAAMTSWALRREWLKALSRLERNPDAAITTARTMLEQACKEVVSHLDGANPALNEGDLPKLLKAARGCLSLGGGDDLVLNGLATIVRGLATRSNSAGDRHASGDPERVMLAEARLFCNLAGSAAVFLAEHLSVRARPAPA